MTTELTTTEAAHRLDVRIDYVEMLLRSGKIAARKQDGRWRVSAEAIEERLSRKARGVKTTARVLQEGM